MKRLLLRLLGRYREVEYVGPVFSKEVLRAILWRYPNGQLVFVYQTNLLDSEDGPWTYDQAVQFRESDIDKLMMEITNFQLKKRFGSWKLDGTRSTDGSDLYESRFWVAVEVYW